MEDTRIHKQTEIHAPVSRVWQALTDIQQFGQWFRVRLREPFVPGQISSGPLTWPGYEDRQMSVITQKIEPERYFSFTWHPYAIDPHVDYSQETPTLVEFTLEATASGTLLSVTESGFENVPPHRRHEAFLRNTSGWAQQLDNINTYVINAHAGSVHVQQTS